MIYIVNRFTSSMLHPASRGTVEIDLSSARVQDVKGMLDRGAKCYGMTLAFAALLGNELGAPVAVNSGRFAPQTGDTVVHLCWHGPSIAGATAFPSDGYLSVRCLYFRRVQARAT